ncbi:hypothetical protein [Nonomuraea sp. WAC 01424]|uniref:hypothetical protein n=1 Tax=Nonomuraea sp. WAC 01424 TaxID=2203200 RepID=UPI000F793F0C|nr:hypothetical protein [Nonomuraea sp. WAC 01424]
MADVALGAQVQGDGFSSRPFLRCRLIAGVQGVAAHHVEQPDVHAVRLVVLAPDLPTCDVLTDESHAALTICFPHSAGHGGLAGTGVASNDDQHRLR